MFVFCINIADEAGYLGSTPSTTPRHSNAQNPTNTPAQSDNSALIDALTQRQNWYPQWSVPVSVVTAMQRLPSY